MSDMDFGFLNDPNYGVGGQIRANDASQLSRADAAYRMAEVAQAPSKIALTTAQARLEGSKADQAELENSAMAKARDTLARTAQGGASNDANYNPNFEIAHAMFDQGAFNAGQKYLEAGTKIEEQRANQRRYDGIAKHEQNLDLKMHIDRVAGMAAGALESQTAYNNFLMQAPAAGYNVQGLPPDLESARPMLEGLRSQGVTASQFLTQSLAAQRLQVAQDAARTQDKLASARIAGIDVQMDYTKARKDDLVKNGGARAEAAIEASKELTTLRRQREQAEQLKTAGLTAVNPKPIPLKEGKPSASDMKPGQFYSNGRGQVGKWDGKQMILVQAPKGAQVKGVASAPASDSGDDDAED